MIGLSRRGEETVGGVVAIDTATGEQWSIGEPINDPTPLALVADISEAVASPDGTRGAASHEISVRRWQINRSGRPDAPKRMLRLPGHRASVNNLAFTAGGAYLVTADQDGVIKLWSDGDAEALRSRQTLSGRIVRVAPGYQSTRFAAGDERAAPARQPGGAGPRLAAGTCPAAGGEPHRSVAFAGALPLPRASTREYRAATR